MPLGKNVGSNIKELYKDNKRSGKARGANGRKRSRKQIIAIAYSATGKSKKNSHRPSMKKSVKKKMRMK